MLFVVAPVLHRNDVPTGHELRKVCFALPQAIPPPVTSGADGLANFVITTAVDDSLVPHEVTHFTV